MHIYPHVSIVTKTLNLIMGSYDFGRRNRPYIVQQGCLKPHPFVKEEQASV